MLKVCIVNPFEHGGGAEYQISLLIDALTATDDYEIHYLTHFVDVRDIKRNYRVSMVGNGGPIPRLGYVMEGRSLYRQLLRIAPSVIYQRVACAYTGICALYSRRHSVPLIWHVASDTDVSPGFFGSERNFVRQRLEKWTVKYAARNATGIVVQTHHQADLLKKHHGRTAAAVIPNFHPPATEPTEKSGAVSVIWIANLKPWKGPEVFVRLAASFSARTDVRFIMVGAPPSEMSSAAWREPLLRGIEDAANLEYRGYLSQAEVNELLGRSHIFVNTSTHEGFPNTFIQAWLRDVVVVSLSVDPDGILEREKVGIVARTESGLEAAVRNLIDDPAALSDYAKRGREHAAAHHSLGNARRLVNLIQAYGKQSGVEPSLMRLS
jgi:glycosyltransferase involved in cell wall biosynthesis